MLRSVQLAQRRMQGWEPVIADVLFNYAQLYVVPLDRDLPCMHRQISYTNSTI